MNGGKNKITTKQQKQKTKEYKGYKETNEITRHREH